MADREGPIQKAIVEYLRRQFPRAYVSSIPNELASKTGSRKDGANRQFSIMKIQVRAKELGMLPGAPDLVMLHQGRAYAFEVKAEGNTQQKNQKAVQEVWEFNGGTYAVVRSIDDVKAVMR